MPLTRKQTAWKKSRTFGDIHGGRRWRKLTDRIFNRLHSFRRPVEDVELPIFRIDNPSKDYFFPISEDDIRQTLQLFSSLERVPVTHVWLRRLRRNDFEDHRASWAEFIVGSGVSLIVIYPCSKDLVLSCGSTKPTTAELRRCRSWNPDLVKTAYGWGLRFEPEQLRSFYLQHLLLHELGHHVDYYFGRQWSKANRKQNEDFANQYAVSWASLVANVIDGESQ